MKPRTYLSIARKRILLALADGPEPTAHIASVVGRGVDDTARILTVMEKSELVATCQGGWRITAGKGAATFNRVYPDYESVDLREAELVA